MSQKLTYGELEHRGRDYLKNVFENSADAIGIVDKHGRFIEWNRTALTGPRCRDLRFTPTGQDSRGRVKCVDKVFKKQTFEYLNPLLQLNWKRTFLFNLLFFKKDVKLKVGNAHVLSIS